MAKVPNEREVALILAAYSGDIDEVKALIAGGVNANATSEVGSLLFLTVPMFVYALCTHKIITQLLLFGFVFCVWFDVKIT